jgi:predicted ArsR family transcriptional regulator
MSTAGVTDPGPAPTLGETRSRVLELLRGVDEPKSAQAIAAGTGLHANTARFHLDGLVAAGLAAREREDPAGPGRPHVAYRATELPPVAGERNYRLLAEMLTSLVAGVLPRPAEKAAEAGREWGRYLVERYPPSHRTDASEALRRVSAMLTRAGFAPEPTDGRTAPVMGLRQCPFREIAEDHQSLVCSLHLGMLQGALTELRAPLGVEKLEPFVEPSRCRAHFRPVPQRDPAATPGARGG